MTRRERRRRSPSCHSASCSPIVEPGRPGPTGRGQAELDRADGARSGRAQAGCVRRPTQCLRLCRCSCSSASTRPTLRGCGANWKRAQPDRSCPNGLGRAAESQRRLLIELESREGILDRRFYAVCEQEHAQELRGLLARSGLSVHPMQDEALQRLVIASALGGSPSDRRPRSEAGRGCPQPPRHPSRRPPGPRAAPEQVAALARARVPAAADGDRRADGPRPAPGADPLGAGGQTAGVAEGPVRVGPLALAAARQDHVARGRDRAWRM